MIYTPKKLDVDLWVDRTPKIEITKPILDLPPNFELVIGYSYTFKILNYNPKFIYGVSFDKGTWSFLNGIIYYNAPSDYYGKIKLRIKVKRNTPRGLVVFDENTVYEDGGKLGKLEKLENGKYFYAYEEAEYNNLSVAIGEDVEYDNNEIESILKNLKNDFVKLPIPTTKKYSDFAKLGEYKINELFGDLGSKKLDPSLKKYKSNNIMSYFLPSESNKAPDDRKYLYKVKDGKFITVPRNSNVTESDGDVFNGYRKPGDVGGSLTVYKGNDENEKVFEWELELILQDLTAILPDKILSVCLPTVSITPVLRGLEFGHTYFWEQIFGDTSSVIWLTPRNQKDVVIQLDDKKDDKIFRFWISRGTRYEKYYDIYIYGTPTSIASYPYGPCLGYGIEQNHLNIKVHECTPIVLSYENIWNKQLRVEIHRNY